MGVSKRLGTGGGGKKWEMDSLSFNNQKDLYYDCDKFSGMKIKKLD